MLRELLRIGQAVAGEGDDFEDLVQETSGTLYLLDLYPEEKRAKLVPYQLDEEKCRCFLWVGDPPPPPTLPGTGPPRAASTTS